jgi:hypothetical protein
LLLRTLHWFGVVFDLSEYSGAMMYVPRSEHLTNALAGLPASEREPFARSEVKLLDCLDRLARREARGVISMIALRDHDLGSRALCPRHVR